MVGVAVDVAASRFASQQQAEDKGLREGTGEQRVAIRRLMPGCGRAGEQRLLELLANLQQRMRQRVLRKIEDDLPGQLGRMSQRLGNLPRVAHAWRRRGSKQIDKLEELRGIVSGDEPLSCGVRGSGF